MHRTAPFLTLISLLASFGIAQGQDEAVTPENIRETVPRLVNQLVQAQPDQAAELRRRLQEFYVATRDANQGFQFARSLSDVVPGALETLAQQEDNRLTRLRRVNLALAVRFTEHPAIQPALEALLKADCPAARFSAWKAYTNLWPAIFSQGPAQARTLVSSMSRALANEENPIILQAVVQIANFTAPEAFNVPPASQASAREQMIESLSDNLARFRKRIESGDESMAILGRRIVTTLADLYSQAARNPQQKTRWLQIVADMMWSSSQAYASARANSNQRLQSLQERILIEAEGLLIDKVGQQVADGNQSLNQVYLAFRNDPTPVAIKLAVSDWVRLLNKLGVEQPQAALGQ